jgi:hypothetical protein
MGSEHTRLGSNANAERRVANNFRSNITPLNVNRIHGHFFMYHGAVGRRRTTPRGMIRHVDGAGVTTSSLRRPRSVSAMPMGTATGRTLLLLIAQTLRASTSRGIQMTRHTAMPRAKPEKVLDMTLECSK